MVEKEVIDYVDRYVSQGYPYSYVRNYLKENDYPEETLKELDDIFMPKKKNILFIIFITIIVIGALAASIYFLYPILKPCDPLWTCTDWNPLGCPKSEMQTRICNDVNNCDKPETKPEESQTCVCKENWLCGDWGECSQEGRQERECVDQTACGTTVDKPTEVMECTPPCLEDWVCQPWTPFHCPEDGVQTRTCIDNNNCGTQDSIPALRQDCEVCIPEWQCGEWSECEDGGQERECTDVNNCNSLQNKPIDDRLCEEDQTIINGNRTQNNTNST